MAIWRPPSSIWFEPKRYGYGAGLPIAWQGWLLVMGYIGIVVVLSLFLVRLHGLRALLPLIGIGGATVILAIVSARHTRGGWRWRWGEDEGKDG